MRTDVVRMYKDIHTWAGIVSGLCLFIAFYAGAITMFEVPLQRWATPPSALPAAPAVQDAPRLVEATLAAHPQAARAYTVNLAVEAESPARVYWQERGPSGRRSDVIRYASSFSADGDLVVQRFEPSPVAQWIDVLHQQVGLPFPHEVSMPIMGAICLLYSVALVSGVIVLIPSLVKDLFILRVGKNLKRMWLDVHNALGIFSLPFHLIMALTALVFAFHDQFYDTQNAALYNGEIDAIWASHSHELPNPGPDDKVLSPVDLAARVKAQAPTFTLHAIEYRTNPEGVTVARLAGSDPRYGTRGPTFGFAEADPYTGKLIDTGYMPGLQSGWLAVVTGFFTLHFGSFGGDPIRWTYFVLGMAGAFLFYSGNLLWVETRRKRMKRDGVPVEQSRSTRLMAALTVGVSLGCVAGVSLTVAAAKWLPGRVENLTAWHMGLYYALFLGATAWAFVRGAARASVELLWACAATTALIPLTSLVGALGLAPGVWSRGGGDLFIDLTATVGVAAFAVMALLTRRRTRSGGRDSVWSAPSGRAAGEPAPSPSPAE